MSRPIEDYALIGDLQTAALVGRDGSIDWLCLPRFDSAACFAALLGDDQHGHWRVAPADGGSRVRRRYRPGTLVLETEFSTSGGTIRLTDCMPPRDGDPIVIRMVEGVRGRVDLRMTLAAQFEYGSAQPRLHRRDGTHSMVAGSQTLWLFGPVHLRSRGGAAVADFTVSEGDRVPLAAVWQSPGAAAPGAPAAAALVDQTARWWASWSAGLTCDGDGDGDWNDAVIRSLITIKALSYAPTGAVVAAATSSLPQQASGVRNWDYRYCWLQDASAAVRVLLRYGAAAEAGSLLGWMTRAVAGPPGQVQDLYGVAGERLLPEIELNWLPGYDGARPARIGNAAAAMPQIRAFGEVMTARLAARMAGMSGAGDPWEPAELLDFLESRWREPDCGIWAARGARRQFVQSKVMVWAAADAAVKMIERFGDPGPADRWRRLRSQVKSDVLGRGYDTGRQTFVQGYDGTGADASLLRLAQLGFLPSGDARLAGTVAAITSELDQGGVLLRHAPDPQDALDQVPASQNGYLPATCWLVQCLAGLGEAARARRYFAGLLELRNDVGLLAEDYDPLRRRFAGNHPLLASHVGLAAAAAALHDASAAQVSDGALAG